MQRQELLNTINQRLQNFDEPLLINLLEILKAIDVKQNSELDQETLEILADEEAMEAIREHRANMQQAKGVDDLIEMGYKDFDEFLAEQSINV